MCKQIILSTLPKTWILDLDGTIVIHNGYKQNGKDTLLEGALDFLHALPESDMIIFITSRKKEYQEATEQFLKEHDIRWDYIIYDAPYGERILINDRKPSGIPMAFSVNTKRDQWNKISFIRDEEL